MASITAYDLTTGDLGAVRTGPTLEGLMRFINPQTHGYVEGEWPAAFYRVDLVSQAVVPKEEA